MLRRLASSGSLRGAITFTLGGAGFALGNVLLAAQLSPTQFGLVALVLALMQFGLSCGPLGLDVVVKRHRPRVTLALLRRVVTNACIVALAIAVAAAWFYQLQPLTAVLLFAGAALAAGNNIVCGVYQSRSQMGWALSLAQGPNYVLLLLALAAQLLSVHSATPILVGVVAGYLAANLLGWSRAQQRQEGYAELDARLARDEGLASVSIGIALQLLWQFERVAIPRLTSVDDLALYAVLASVIAAPFRVLQFGVGFTLIDSLRRAPTAGAARAVLKHEIMVGLALASAAVVVVILISPLVFHTFLHDKYVISRALMAVTIAVGLLRVAEGFSTASVTALGTAHSLARISALGWLALAVAAVAATILSRRYGLVGIICGTLLGWLTLWSGGFALAVGSFRRRFAGPGGTQILASQPE